MSLAPPERLRRANDAPVQPGDYVLYWMIAARRTRFNPALEHALDRARELGVGLVVLEALRLDYRWASPRHHHFVVQGMADNARAMAGSPVRHLAYVEEAVGAGSGLLEALAGRASLVVSDHFPCFFLPAMVGATAERLGVRLEVVDGHGLLPLGASDRPFRRAVDFRRHLQKTLRPHLDQLPQAEPLCDLDLPRPTVDPSILSRWPMRPRAELDDSSWVDRLPLAGSVPPASGMTGGMAEAGRRLDRFVNERLDHYADGRNHPDEECSSTLSPWLHFGHLGAHEVFSRVMERDGWGPERLAEKANGRREGWWGASPEVEAFLDQLVTWRELGAVFCEQRPHDYDRYEALPEWARRTLDEHRADERPVVYDLATLDGAATHDPIWNAAQRQLRQQGRIHNYLRMLWGKKVLQWSAAPERAFEILVELNNRYALDGRDPNSASGIGWCFGLFDRAWGPERPIFGKVRYMTSDSTRRKLRLKGYLERWGGRSG